MDALIRFRRMQGRNTLWQPGTDHAGIATQMLVERQLEATGQNRHDDLVGGGRAIDHEVGVIRPEVARRPGLGFGQTQC